MARKRIRSERPKQRIMLNVGALLDIPSSVVITGARGESIVMGGVADIEAIAGAGNSFKSVILYHMALAAANVVASTHQAYVQIYDTENNITESRIESLARKFDYLQGDIFDHDDGVIDYTDKSVSHGDEWWNNVKTFLSDVCKDKKDMVEYTGIVDKKGNAHKDFLPTVIVLDSFSKFESKASLDMLEKSKKDDSSTNTYFMKAGAFKSKMLTELSMLAPKGNAFFLTSAHIGTKSTMDENKYSKPVKTLGYMKDTEALKNTTKEFTYLTKILYKSLGTSPLKADDNISPLYPMKGAVDTKTDLNVVKIETIRNKNGASGVIIPLVISQSEGVLPDLTNFHYIKSNGYYGLDGNPRSFHSVFLPSVSLNRTTIRTKLDGNSKLRRAISITADLLQLAEHKPEIKRMGLLMSPAELHQAIVERGYDWNDLLDTRSWFAIDQYSDKLPPFLSTIDLLRMGHGDYHPYWMPKQTKKK